MGDVVVFKAPPAENCGEPVTDLVKRVIGIPGRFPQVQGQHDLLKNARTRGWHALKEKWTHTEPLGQPITPIT